MNATQGSDHNISGTVSFVTVRRVRVPDVSRGGPEGNLDAEVIAAAVDGHDSVEGSAFEEGLDLIGVGYWGNDGDTDLDWATA